ncbi:hypothetical protein AA309_27950 [Microvirga vignae]|uniref:Mannose-6-phosphate isomerase type II C-terminal domain-containing protein n=1 Tax=Microvirga vignae TaxID=1225564 RepID=A0A0H1R4R9_9HYPH|nr:hypothetical protein AA309_27950 [Microvirga vignae]
MGGLLICRRVQAMARIPSNQLHGAYRDCLNEPTDSKCIPLEVIEVQVGSYTGEDDIVRVEDVYVR